MDQTELQRAIEAILFAAGERVETARLSMALETDEDEIVAAANALADTYAFERRGIRILRLDNGYQMVSEAVIFPTGSADHYRVLSACYQGDGGADPWS